MQDALEDWSTLTLTLRTCKRPEPAALLLHRDILSFCAELGIKCPLNFLA